MAALGFELLWRFLWGSLIVLFFISRQEASERFLKLAFYISFGVWVFCLWLYFSQSGFWGMEALLSSVLLIVGFALYVFSNAPILRILALLLVGFSPLWGLCLRGPVHMLNFALSGLLLGSIFIGQYLGHWYLTVAGMHIRELKRICIVAIVTIGAKSLEISLTLFNKNSHQLFRVDEMGRPLPENLHSIEAMQELSPVLSVFALKGDMWAGFGSYGLLLLGSRLLWGIVAPLILMLMVYQTVRTRSTQSATGILYAACVMVIIGEAAALYLYQQLGYFL